MSTIEHMVRETCDAAAALGHTLGRFRFRYGTALAACVACEGSVCVNLGDATAVGVAVALPCRHGEPRVPLAPVPPMPTGRAKPVPVPARSVRTPTPAPLHVLPPRAVPV